MKGFCQHCRVLGGSTVENNGGGSGKHMQRHHEQVRLISELVRCHDKVSRVEENILIKTKCRAGRSNVGRWSRSSHAVLSKACYDILKDKTNGRRVYCKKCDRSITIIEKSGSLHSNVAINHARIHVGNIIFNCPHCDRGFQTMHAIRQHVKMTHGQGYNAEMGQQDESPDSIKAVLDMVKECFGNKGDKETATPKLSSVQLFLERKRHMMDILQYHGGNIRCKICGKETRQKLRRNIYDSSHRIDHARLHLDKPMFQCKLCGHDAHSYWAIQGHIRQKHRVFIQDQYEDYSDQFQFLTNILSIFFYSCCFFYLTRDIFETDGIQKIKIFK